MAFAARNEFIEWTVALEAAVLVSSLAVFQYSPIAALCVASLAVIILGPFFVLAVRNQSHFRRYSLLQRHFVYLNERGEGIVQPPSYRSHVLQFFLAVERYGQSTDRRESTWWNVFQMGTGLLFIGAVYLFLALAYLTALGQISVIGSSIAR